MDDEFPMAASVLLPGLLFPIAAFVRRRHGTPAAARFAVVALLVLGVQQALVAVGLHRLRGRLAWVDCLTLSRGLSSAMLAGLVAAGVRDRATGSARIAFAALLYGEILTDWLDGPLARRVGSSELRETFDWESDSLLTVCAAAAAVGWGDLPHAVLLPPLLRYEAVARAVRRGRYNALRDRKAPWDRPLGILQMLLFTMAIAPFRGPLTSRAIRTVLPVHLFLQACHIAATRTRTPA